MVSDQNRIVVFTDDRMGTGAEELGKLLLRNFLKTILRDKFLPRKIVCYNQGVRLGIQGSPVLEELFELAKGGVELLFCGTCLDYYKSKDKLAVGKISNMGEIAKTLFEADSIVTP